MKRRNKRVNIAIIGIALMLIGALTAIPEVVARNCPLFFLEPGHLQNVSGVAVSALVILGLIIGTVLQIAIRDTDEVKFGYTANERVLFFNSLKKLGLEINLLEILLTNYLLIPAAVICYIFSWHNAVITILFISLIITLIEFVLSIVIISNNTVNIDNKCKEQIRNDVKAGEFAILDKILLSFYKKINDEFIFCDEYLFFIEILQTVEKDRRFPMYYAEAQMLVSNLIYERKLSVRRTLKVTEDLIVRPNFKAEGQVLIYIDDAIIWAANNTNWETKSLFQILEMCYYKFLQASRTHHDLHNLMSKFSTLFIELEENNLMSQFDYRKNITAMEYLAFDFATLKQVVVSLYDHEKDYYIEFDEEMISIHQIPLFSIIRHYIRTRNVRIIGILLMLNKKQHKLRHLHDGKQEFRLDFNNAKLKYLLLLKLSYVFFTLSKQTETSDELKKFIQKIVNDIGRSFSFIYLVKKIHLIKKISIRKDDYYDYFFPISMGMNDARSIEYLVCFSILKDLYIDYRKYINIEIGYAVRMFNADGTLKPEHKAYMNHISSFYEIPYSEKRTVKIFTQIMKEAKKHGLDSFVNEEKYARKHKLENDVFDEQLIK